MFDFGVGYSEMFVLAIMAILVIGPKDLPKVLRTVGQFVRKARGMAREFQGHVDAAMKETGVEDIKKSMGGSVSFPPAVGVASSKPITTVLNAEDNARMFDKNSSGETKVGGIAVEISAT